MIAHPRNPRVQLLREDVCIALDERVTLLLSTEAECDHLIAQLVKARTLLEAQAKARSERAEQLAARSVNRANEASHKAWGSTLSGTVTPIESVEKTVKFVSCDCTRFFVCDEHVQSDGAA